MIESSAAQRQVAALSLEPMLEGMLAPLTEAMGEFGEIVAETCAEKIASQLSP
ncbi:MAG TPA: hypothetical protein VFW34_06365 [Candidatus Rubrimentiphilum sp.]|nr:hypothetical protein [Candidatus Rubrimentiphilum sp.]